MTYKQYMERRNALLDESQALIDAGKLEEANAKQEEIKALDAKYEAAALAAANHAALAGAPVAEPLENRSVAVPNARPVDTTMPIEDKDAEDKLYLNAWCARLQGRAMSQQEKTVFDRVNTAFDNAYTHDTSNTAILIPTTVAAGIWKRAGEAYPLYADARKYAVTGKLAIKMHTGITAGDAKWYTEPTATEDEQNTFGELVLDGRELSKAVTITWKLRAMAMDEFIPFITNELGDRLGVALGTSAHTGAGAQATPPEPQGVVTALLAESGTPQVVTYDDADPLTYAKLTEAMGKLHSSYVAGAAIYANSATIWGQLANIMDLNGRPLFVPDVTGGGVGRMFGLTVKPDAGAGDNNILFGNAAQGLVYNVNEPLSITTEEHAKERKTDYVAYTVVDGGVLDTKAFVLLRSVQGA